MKVTENVILFVSFSIFPRREHVKNASKQSKRPSDSSVVEDLNLDQYKSSDWFLKIALIVAVTLLVTTCIVGVMAHNQQNPDHEWRSYVFPMHQLQLHTGG